MYPAHTQLLAKWSSPALATDERRGEGVKGFLNNVKKTALFLSGGFPLSLVRICAISGTVIVLGQLFLSTIVVRRFNGLTGHAGSISLILKSR